MEISRAEYQASMFCVEQCISKILSVEVYLFCKYQCDHRCKCGCRVCWELAHPVLRPDTTFLHCDLNRGVSHITDTARKESISMLAQQGIETMEKFLVPVGEEGAEKVVMHYEELDATFKELLDAFLCSQW